jgi:homogentisate phytyltransferase/homogentisate geranylgeranyltransferase
MIIIGIIQIYGINSWILIPSHLSLLGLIIWRSQRVDLDNKGEITKFYQFIWKLFFLEYLLFPTACLFS